MVGGVLLGGRKGVDVVEGRMDGGGGGCLVEVCKVYAIYFAKLW